VGRGLKDAGRGPQKQLPGLPTLPKIAGIERQNRTTDELRIRNRVIDKTGKVLW